MMSKNLEQQKALAHSPKDNATGVSRWLPILVAACVLASTLFLWRNLVAHERAEHERMARLAAASVRDQIMAHIESQILALVRMAERWELRGQPSREEWEQDANLYVSHYKDFQFIAWVDPSFQVRWVVPPGGNKAIQSLNLSADERVRTALEAARDYREPKVTHAIDVAPGVRGFLVNVPIFPGEEFGGCIVAGLRLQELVDYALSENLTLLEYSIEVFDGEENIYSSDPAAGKKDQEQLGQDTNLDLCQVRWRVRVWPRTDWVEQTRSHLPDLALAAGVLMAGMLAVAVHFAQEAQFRAKRLGVINEDLQREIIEREQAQQALRESELRLRLAIQASDIGLWDLDLRMNKAYYSSQWKSQLGYMEDEISDSHDEWMSRLHPDDRQRILSLVENYLEGAWPDYEAEFRLRHKDGSYRWILSRGEMVLDAEGKPYRMMGAHIDITQRKQAETERAKLEEQFLQAQKMEAVGRLAGGVAHDFNNLLSAIIGYSEMALAHIPREDQLHSDIEQVRNAGNRAAGLTRQLLAFSRKQVLEMRVLDGNVWVYSEPGLGTTFKIYLPQVDAEQTQASAQTAGAEGVRGSETIMVVEDDEMVRKLVSNILASHGYKIIAARDGREALHLAEQPEGAIHLLLTDVIMPAMNGKELSQRLAVIRPYMRVLYMSGYTDDVIAHHGVLEPGVNFLQKPLSVWALTQKVREVLDG